MPADPSDSKASPANTPQASSAPRVVAGISTGAAHQATGHWTASAIAGDPDAKSWRRGLPVATPETRAWNLRGLQSLDHVGAQMLWELWGQRWPNQLDISDDHRSLIQRVADLSEAPTPIAPPSFKQRYLALGGAVMAFLDQLLSFVGLLGQLLLDLLKLARAPQKGPWRDVSGHLYHFGATALPITALVGFLIGVVLAYLSAQQLKQFGADAFIVNLLGVSLVRELGPMLAAILIAGRSGSAITAQIGVMRVNEELDAMRVMGIPHGFRLVMPRAVALAIAMPLISVWTTVMALLGGMLASDIALGISPQFFINALPAAVDVANLLLAVGKTVVFGILIALVACHFGLRIEPNTESLGKGTTASVVTSITVVILVDALFAIAFRDIGV